MYADVPPVTAPIVAVPFALPQVLFVEDVANAVGPGISEIATDVVIVHPLTSFIITAYVPIAKDVKLVVAPKVPPLNE